MRIVKKYPIINVFHHTLFTYPAPSNLTYLWNFGSLALICLAIQIITGIFLAMHYVPNADLAFSSVEHIMRDVNFGWLLRYLHANGASMFFLVVYFHIFRGLYYGSFSKPRELLWCTGVIILLLMILTAFLGYVLPWGQMSFWAATVITNLASAIPFGIGDFVVSWLWGGFSVGNATLNRFFSLHYLFPFIILALAFIHLILLHENGSNNPLGIGFKSDNISFGPYFLVKDLFGFVVFLFIYFFFLYFFPNYLGHSDNYIPANPLVTPAHIVPEWYFLPFYAILRSVPDKLLGVLLLLGAIFILLLLPFFIKITVRSNIFKPVTKFFFWFFLVDCLILGWIGGKPIESPFLEIGKFATLFYFYYFLLILPFLKFFENIIFFNQNSTNIVKNKIGALTSKPYAFQARPWELLSIESFDIFDSFGSTIRIDLRGSKILRILPKFSNINQQWISDRIRFSYDSLNFQKILSPFFKNVDNILVSCSWEYSFLFLKKIFLSVNSSKQLLFKFGSLSDFLSIVFFKKFLNFFGSNNFCNQKNSDFRNLNIHFFSLNFDSLCLLGLNLRIESPILNLRLKKQFINKFIFLFGVSSYNLNFFYYFLGLSSFSFFNFFLGRSFFSFLFYLKKNLFFIGVDFNLNLVFLEKLKSIFLNSLFIFWNNSISKNNLSEISISSINSFINFNIQNIYYLYHIDFFSSYFLNNNFLIFQGYQGDSFLSNFNLILPSLSFFEQSLFFINNLNDFFKLDVCLKSNSISYTNLKFIHLLFKTKFFYICLNFFFGLWFFQVSKKLSSFYFLYSFSLLFLVNNQIIYQFFNNFYITNLWTKNSLNLSTASKLYFKKKLHYNEHAN